MITDKDMERVFGSCVEPDDETLFLEMCDDFCVQVIFEMERQGLTVTELARRMGVAQPTLSRQLSGEQNLTVKTMDRMARALGCSLEAPRLVRPSEEPLAAIQIARGNFEHFADPYDPEVFDSGEAGVCRRVSGNVWTASVWEREQGEAA